MLAAGVALMVLAGGAAGCGLWVMDRDGDVTGGSGGSGAASTGPGGEQPVSCQVEVACQEPCPDGACDAQGACKSKPGDACGEGAECASGQCVEGVCRCVAEISAEWATTCVRKADGSACCWGINEYGEIGDGTLEPRLSPVKVVSLGPVSQIAAGSGYACAVRADGGVSCWGGNVGARLGNGSVDEDAHPVPGDVVPFGVPPVRELSLGLLHVCARDSTDEVWCWGDTSGAQLGTGDGPTGALVPAPTQATLVGPMVELEADWDYSCGRAADGTVWCWGHNQDVPIGDGSEADVHPVPVQVSGLEEVVEIAMGGWQSCARKSDGTLWCWGKNYGPPGNQDLLMFVPEQMFGLNDVVEVDVGSHFSCVRRDDGSVWCWGFNASGELGGTPGGPSEPATTKPVQIALPGPAAEVTLGSYHACARLTDDSVWCWGGFPKASNPSLNDPDPNPVPVKMPVSCP